MNNMFENCWLQDHTIWGDFLQSYGSLPNEVMALLKPAFLDRLVRATVEDTCPAFAVGGHLNRLELLEFRHVSRALHLLLTYGGNFRSS